MRDMKTIKDIKLNIDGKEALQSENIGVRLTKECMMVPQKSLSWVIG